MIGIKIVKNLFASFAMFLFKKFTKVYTTKISKGANSILTRFMNNLSYIFFHCIIANGHKVIR